MSDDLLIEHADAVSTIILNRPPLNLLTLDLLREICAAFDTLEARKETRCVVLRGAGTRAFSAGADLKVVSQRTADSTASWREVGRFLVDRIERFPKPVISAVQGWCIGGGTGLAWPADIRIVAESAKFRAGDIYLGLSPTWGMGMVRLGHYLGRNRTLDIILLGEDITGRQAYEMGLATKVVPDDGFDAEVARVAAKLSTGAPLPIQAIKEGVRAQYMDSPDRASLVEDRWAKIVAASHDAKEGTAAGREKRKPNFIGE